MKSLRFVIVLAASVGLWQLLVNVLHLPSIILPTPVSVFREFMDEPSWVFVHSYYTLLATLIGFGLAVVIGVLIAIGIVYSKALEETVYAALVSMNSIPKIALAPLLIIWIGTGLGSKITMAAVLAIFAIVVDAVLGLRSVDPDLLDLARSYGGRPISVLLKVRLPNAWPSIFAGMKVGISLALVGTIVGEFVSSSAGLGYIIMVSQGTYNTPRIFAALLLLAAMGTLLFFILDRLEQFVLPWHVSRRGASNS